MAFPSPDERTPASTRTPSIIARQPPWYVRAGNERDLQDSDNLAGTTGNHQLVVRILVDRVERGEITFR